MDLWIVAAGGGVYDVAKVAFDIYAKIAGMITTPTQAGFLDRILATKDKTVYETRRSCEPMSMLFKKTKVEKEKPLAKLKHKLVEAFSVTEKTTKLIAVGVAAALAACHLLCLPLAIPLDVMYAVGAGILGSWHFYLKET